MSAQTSEEQRLIDGLFSRLQEAETKSGDRDKEAEARIQEHVSRQPAAPYYMAQTILIQEAALKQLQARVVELERQAEQSRPSSGGFLAGIFGAGDKRPQDQSTTQQSSHGGNGQPGWGRNSQPGWGARSAAPGYGGSRGGGFLSGALQTAAGVAGGVMLGNMLMNMFDEHQPEDLANAIDGNADAAPASDTTADASDGSGNYDNADYNDPAMDEPRFEDADYYDGDGGGFDDGGFDEV